MDLFHVGRKFGVSLKLLSQFCILGNKRLQYEQILSWYLRSTITSES